jgi:uncharacterized protein (TIGR02391 family)
MPLDEDPSDFLDDDEFDYDEPDYDDPPNRLRFDDLHPLIRDAVRAAWVDAKYPEAVTAGWHALRDEIRRKLGTSALDGTDLVNRIGETEPTLALTDYATETDRNMHRGVVNLLRGIVFYMRRRL